MKNAKIKKPKVSSGTTALFEVTSFRFTEFRGLFFNKILTRISILFIYFEYESFFLNIERLSLVGKNSHTADVKVIAPHHQHMVKRESVYDDYPPGTNSEILEPIYQMPGLDYDDFNQALNEIYGSDDDEIHEDKRFLGK